MAMGITRMLDHNMYHYVVSGYNHGSQDWSNVKVTTEFPRDTEDLTLPTTAVYRQVNTDRPFELGSNEVVRTDRFVVSLFCDKKGQRDDLAEFTKDLFSDSSKQFLDFNTSFDPMGGQPSLGIINFDFISMQPEPDLSTRYKGTKYIMNILVNVEYIYDPNN